MKAQNLLSFRWMAKAQNHLSAKWAFFRFCILSVALPILYHLSTFWVRNLTAQNLLTAKQWCWKCWACAYIKHLAERGGELLRDGFDGELLRASWWRAACAGQLGVMESYWYICVTESWVWESYCGFGVMELQRAGCDVEQLRVECDGELLRAGCDGELQIAGCDEKLGVRATEGWCDGEI